ncbi:MAG: DUF305 domain-containing protein [Actinomycetota bacterium]|jgi:uncharacterized protein (DUF305 family)
MVDSRFRDGGAVAPDPDEAAEPEEASWVTPSRVVVLGLALMFLAGVVGYRIGLPNRPGAGSADVGFLQDMIVHHKQAVTMSFRTAEAATDAVVRSFAKEIIALQEYEIGLMDAWLDGWGHPRESPGSTSMGWAGMAHPKAFMPGMASDQELEALDAATGRDLDDRFLRMMIGHHSGGVAMAQAYLERGSDSKVRELAGRILKNQRIEISEMNFARQRLGLAPVEVPSFDDHLSGGGATTTSAARQP